MAVNIRSELVELPEPIAPNYRGVTSVIQKIYPQANIVSATNTIAGDLNIIWTVPTGYRMDVSKSHLVFDVSCITAGGAATAETTVAPNLPATFFATGRLNLNDQLCALSTNVPQDDTLMKRISFSRQKLKSMSPAYWGSDTERIAAWATVLRQKINWQPTALLAPDQIIPENVRCHLQFNVHPDLHTVTRSPAYIRRTAAGNADDGTLLFYDIYFLATFVKVATPIPKQVFVPSYTITSMYRDVSTMSQANHNFTLPKETYKLAVFLQSGAATHSLGLVYTKFASGEIPAGGVTRQSTYSAFLQNLQVRFAGATYPAAPYNLSEAVARSNSVDAYCDFLNNTDALMDPSGSESFDEWRDPILVGDQGLGRVMLFNLVVPENNSETSCEVNVSFSTPPTSTRLWVVAISKAAWGIQYDNNMQIQEVRPVPFS